MKVIYSWLKDFVNMTAAPEQLASRLALAGTNVGGMERLAGDAVLDAEVTSNRPDCLGMLGIAREVSAIYGLPLKQPAPRPAQSTAPVADAVRVSIETPELCGRFTARVIRGVRIQPSPAWLANRLALAGVSTINNVVDATNYVMLELGHPLHAFDYDRVRGGAITVRGARANEKIKTLDGLERALGPGIPAVCDDGGKRAIGIGGIMGGAETEISSATKNVLIECAWFDPIAIRRATRALKLHTEASMRFGRGADPEMAETASRRCAELILQLAGGELLLGVADVYPGKRAPGKIRLTRAELLRILGADVPDKDVEAILSALGFAPVRSDENRGAAESILAAWDCTQPSWRADAEREIDLIEEVARVYGLDRFPPRLPAARAGAARVPYYEAESRVRERLIGLGYREIVTIPHTAEERDALFRPANAAVARLANPLSEQAGVLRSTGVAGMTSALEWNLNHGQRSARLFEIGLRYRLNGGQAVEERVLSLGATGEAREKNLYEAAREFSFADWKGDLDALGELAGGFTWRESGTEWLSAASRGTLVLGENAVGAAGQLAQGVAGQLKFRQEVFLAELALDPLYAAIRAASQSRRYEPLPRFPAVERDFSLLLAEGTSFAAVAEVIRSLAIAETASIEAADLYRGKNVPAGKMSLLVRVTFQSRAATLTDAQVADYSAQVVEALEKRLGAQLRAS
jgi:phenylalanyl-tRNA synthetase beta chain